MYQHIQTVHRAMGGSSSVPQDWLAIINQYGEDMGQTCGVPVEEIVEGINNSVRWVYSLEEMPRHYDKGEQDPRIS